MAKDQVRFDREIAQFKKKSSKINYFDIVLSLNIFKCSKINKNIYINVIYGIQRHAEINWIKEHFKTKVPFCENYT